MILTPDRLKTLVDRLPFKPLVVTVDSGDTVPIRHSEEVWIFPDFFQVITQKDKAGIILGMIEVPFMHVASIETVTLVDELGAKPKTEGTEEE